MQAIYNEIKTDSSNFSIVRFGNVLESSGSLIPKVKMQIKKGGPVTLTHNDITRYFMTVTEAAQLVIQAGAMAKKCEVFVLDMGESVKIKELIIKMITMSGFKLKDKKNPNGDIEIKITGLRPGEKLYEELLIGDNPQKTIHKKISKIRDPFISYNDLLSHLDNLKSLIQKNKAEDVKLLLDNVVSLYKSNSELVDHISVEHNLINRKNKNLDMDKTKYDNIVKIK